MYRLAKTTSKTCMHGRTASSEAVIPIWLWMLSPMSSIAPHSKSAVTLCTTSAAETGVPYPWFWTKEA